MEPAPANPRVRCLSFNINGLRACLKRREQSLAELLDSLGADIICFQETKLKDGPDRGLALVPGWESFFSSCSGSRAYSGVATYVRCGVATPFACEQGFTGCLAPASGDVPGTPHPSLAGHYSADELSELDAEGRVVITDHGAFLLFNLYAPAVTSEKTAEARMVYRLRLYEAMERRWRAELRAGKGIVVVGDFNLCPAPIDFPDYEPPAQFYRASRPDRLWMRELLAGGHFHDVFRAFHPNRAFAYTVWNTMTGARAANYGSRIDLVLSAGLPLRLEPANAEACAAVPATNTSGARASAAPGLVISGCDIQPEVQGSDHCPVFCTFEVAGGGGFPCASQPPPGSSSLLFGGKQLTLRSWLAVDGSSGPAAAPPEPAGAATQAGTGPASERAAVAEARSTSTASRPSSSSGSAATAKQASLRSFFGAPGAVAGSRPAAPARPAATQPAESFIAAELAAAERARAEALAEARSVWQQIQQRMVPPKCEHGEPTVMKRVNKPGPNKGRFFYMCGRPEGPRPPEGRCRFWKWVDGGPVAGSAGSGGSKRMRSESLGNA